MKGILKSIAIVAIVSFFLSACGGESSGETSGDMPSGGGLDTSQLSAEALRGHDIYVDPTYACTSCHGLTGKGTAAGGALDNLADCPTCSDHTTLTAYNEALMPAAPYSPASCTGACASDVSQFILEGFIQGLATGSTPPPPPAPGIVANVPAGFSTTEGANSTFQVSLNSSPADNVDITITSSDLNEGSIDPATAIHTFTAANWQQPFTVNVMGVDDALLDVQEETAYSITISPMSNDPEYNNLAPTVINLVNRDNEVAGQGTITVDPTAGLTTSEADANTTATFTVVLGTAPSAGNTVTIGISSNNVAEGATDVASVTFDENNFNVAQTITIAGVDDALDDGDVAYAIVTAAAVSGVRAYSGVDAADVMVTNLDDDEAAVINAFTATPTSNAASPIPYAGSVTLAWDSDGDTCTAGGANPDNQWMGALAASDSKILTNLTTAGLNQFSLVCTKGGIASAAATVDVFVAPQPGAAVVNLSADPNMNIAYNGQTLLTWTTTDAVDGTCVASGGWNGPKDLSGTETITGLLANTAFTLTCANVLGVQASATETVTVVVPNPTISLVANPATVGEGQSYTLTWATTDMTSCEGRSDPANVQWPAAPGFNGSLAINNIFDSTDFTLDCDGIDGQDYVVTATVTVDPTSTGEYLYQTETFPASTLMLTCANASCHGPTGNMGTLLTNKADLCTTYLGTAGLIGKIRDTMPPLSPVGTCDDACATKILNYMLENFYGADQTDCEGGALPLAIP